MSARTNEPAEIQKRASRAKARAFRKELSTKLLTKRYPEDITLPLCISLSWFQNKAAYFSAFHIYPGRNLASELTHELPSFHENMLKLCRLLFSHSLT